MKQSDRLERILHRRSDRLMQLISMQFGTGRGALKTFADRLGYKESQLSRWTNRKQFLREDSARYIEEQLSLKELWMDMPNEPIEQSSALIASEPMPPLYTQLRAQEQEKDPVIAATERAMRAITPDARRMVLDLALFLSKQADHQK